jgi:hypothetical protein
MYLLRFRENSPVGSRLRPTGEPVRDVEVQLFEGWRTITASKWMPSNLKYWIEKDLGALVTNQARAIGDFDFDLRWKVGDIMSINLALAEYGLEVVPGQTEGDGAN